MNKNEFKQLLSEKILILDGATGTELHKRNFLADVSSPEELNLKYPERLTAVHHDYFAAGADMVLANTFGANRIKLADFDLQERVKEVIDGGVAAARKAAAPFKGLVAGDIGSLGAYLTPLGNITFDQAYETFSEQARLLAAAGCDALVIETMPEIREVKACLLAAKDNFPGPVIVQMTFTADGVTVTGTDILAFLAVVESMGADALGLNCSVGPHDLMRFAKVLAANTSLPLSFKPNAGMPKLVNRQTIFPGTPEEFVAASEEAYTAGVNMLGGCCGTSPEFIRPLAAKLKGRKPAPRTVKEKLLLASRTKGIDLNTLRDRIVVIGERINPTNRKKFQEELLAGNFSTIRKEAQAQVKSGAHILDLNLGLPGADEKALMMRAVEEIQEVVNAPLCLDSSSAEVLEAGLKTCAGKPIINSVNGDDHRLDVILPLAKRYGAAVIGLTVDERGLPKSAADRLAIAEKIANRARHYGLPESELIFDFLTLAASAMADQLAGTLEAIRTAKKRWPAAKTVLGVSNVSFGLPNRQALNSTFLKMAREAGLDMAILNPHETWDIDDDASRQLILGKDPGGANYIAKHSTTPKKVAAQDAAKQPADVRLYNAVVDGSKEEIAATVHELLSAGAAPLIIANDILLKALNDVGTKFNNKEYFLPQVIRAAEAAQTAFGVLKPLITKAGTGSDKKIVMATVKGDVHDIGKNIVSAVLESHGWDVIDLGKNIESEDILAAAVQHGAKVVGLSALMTTTMLEMEKAVQTRNAKKLDVKILIGGAPVTERFAAEIGADGYAKDAVEAAAVASRLLD